MAALGAVQEVKVYLKSGKSFESMESFDLNLPSGAALAQVQGGSVVMPGRGGIDFSAVGKVLKGDGLYSDLLDASITKEERNVVVGPVGTKVMTFKVVVADISLSGKVESGDASFTVKFLGKRETLKAV